MDKQRRALSTGNHTGFPPPRRSSILIGTVVLMTVLCWPLFGADTATLVGTVTDPAGAAIPGAAVTISNPTKGFMRQLVTNSAGAYMMRALPIGTYVVTVEKPGFQKAVSSGITLTVGQVQQVNFKLQVGEVTQTVTVSGNVARVQTERGAVSNLVTSTQIQNLTMNGRDFMSLFALTPGAAYPNGLNSIQLGAGGSENSTPFNGARPEAVNMELDGSDISDTGDGGNGGKISPPVDTIAEMRITTSNYGADEGQRSGAQIQIVTKAGTDKFHGGAHEFVRNNALDANDFFLNRRINPPGGNAPAVPLKWNVFGFDLGGPLYIPGHYNTSKSKTFFFWAENWARYRQGSVISANTPSLAMRTGDFSQCDPKSPNANPVIIAQGCAVPKNPLTGQPFPGDIVPMDPNAKILLNSLFPLPNNGVDGYITAPSLPTNWRDDTIRIDENLTDKTSAFFRVTNESWTQTVAPSLFSSDAYDTIVTPRSIPAEAATFHVVHTFNPTLMNEFIAGFSNSEISYLPAVGPSNVAGSIDKPSNWTMQPQFLANAGQPLLPGVTLSGGSPIDVSENTGAAPFINANPVISFKDDVSKVTGHHTFIMGAFFLRSSKSETTAASTVPTQGALSFSSSSAVSTGNSLADMFLGRIANYSEGVLTANGVPVGGTPKYHFRYVDFEPFIQDNWKVASRLTLNLGLRYQFFTPMKDFTNPPLSSTFIPSLYNPALQAPLNSSGFLAPNPATGQIYDSTNYGNGLLACGVGVVRSGCTDPTDKNFAPRFGFAWDPFGHGTSSIRGGYGIFYDVGDPDDGDAETIEGNPPAILVPTTFNVVGYQNIVPGLLGPSSIKALEYNNSKWTSVQQFSLTVEHQFPGNNLLSIGYVGSLAHHLGQYVNLNQIPIGATTMTVPALAGKAGCTAAGVCDVQNTLIHNLAPTVFFVPYGGYSTIGLYQNTANSNYNSLQVTLRHTFSHGLSYDVIYTWAHALGNAPPPSNSVGGGSIGYYNNLNRWYGNSYVNVPQDLTLDYVYQLPFFKNSSSAFVKNTLGGWRVSGITQFMNGTPINFACGVSRFSSAIGGAVRCNTVEAFGVKKGVVDDKQFGPTPTWFDPTTITQPLMSQLFSNNEPGMFGYQGTYTLTGPGNNVWDIALFKTISLPWVRHGESSNLTFRLETFNTFNHPNWSGINAGCASTIGFGQPCTQLGNGEVSSDRYPRNLQLGLQFSF
ncbi:MAG: carboxypeptidase regulatory-like domain-containing protein [Terriglobia bacterium]